jgi:hypothetical protein
MSWDSSPYIAATKATYIISLLNILSHPPLGVTFGAQNAMLVMAKCYWAKTGATWN